MPVAVHKIKKITWILLCFSLNHSPLNSTFVFFFVLYIMALCCLFGECAMVMLVEMSVALLARMLGTATIHLEPFVYASVGEKCKKMYVLTFFNSFI